MNKTLFIILGFLCFLCAMASSTLPQGEEQQQGRFKVIFKDTPFVKYAGENGVIYLGQNFYHHIPDMMRAFGYSVKKWVDEENKEYLVDDIPTDTIVSRYVLTKDVVLTPVYSLNEEDLGDGTVTPTWNFAYPDSIANFNQFKGVCNFVKAERYNSFFCDINMVCDATNGMIDNEGRTAEGNAIVKAGTRFRLPSRYGTIYTLVTAEALSSTTIASRTDYMQGMEGTNHTATLHYNNSTTDSIDIIIGEDIHLVSISASYPGGDTTPTWIANTNVAETTIGTLSKSGAAGALLYDLTDIMVCGGLNITASAADSLTSQIEMTEEKDEGKYVSVGFDVAKGFSFKLTNASVPVKLEGAGMTGKVELVMTDERGNQLDTLYANVTSDSLIYDTLMNVAKPTETYFYGHVTLKVYVYGAAATFRLGGDITMYGEICETVTCGEGKEWATYVAKTPIDKDGVALLQIDCFEIVGVYEKRTIITPTAIEEIHQGTPLLIHTDVPGAIFNIPLTRCDDAYIQGNNLLRVSDGTETADRLKYFFRKEGDLYAFFHDNDGRIIPEGEVFLEYDTFNEPRILFLTYKEALGIDDIPLEPTAKKPQKIFKSGQLYILNPDGTVYTFDGARIR